MQFGVLLQSSMQEPWRSIVDLGARPTWMAQSSVPILEYVGTDRQDRRDDRLVSSVLETASDQPLRHVLGIATRSLWIRQSLASRALLQGYKYTGKISVVTPGSLISIDIPEARSFLGLRAVLAISYFLETFPHVDYIVRTNSSSYINLEAVNFWLEDKPRRKFYSGPAAGRQLPIRFAGGAFVVMSRDVAMTIAASTGGRSLFPMAEDVFMGARLARSGLRVEHHESVVLPSPQALDAIGGDDLYRTPHFRCKVYIGDRRVDTEIMHALHARLTA